MGDLTSRVQFNQHVVSMLVTVIVLVPFQAAAEEVVFRGLATNTIVLDTRRRQRLEGCREERTEQRGERKANQQ